MSFNDHRSLAADMELYFFDERIGAGLPVWLPRGAAIREELERYMKALEQARGYQRVVSPHLARAQLYERSGHLECFREDMFPPLGGEDELYLRPMNCPHHHLAFASSPRSYRQLPLRLAEFGQVYRRENSGSLQGLARARGLCQNDAHIYVDPARVLPELIEVLKLQEQCYRELGLRGHRYRLSLREEGREGEGWDKAEELLRLALRELGLPWFEAPGEAVFYGPKIDVQMQIAGREQSVASVQLDFLSGERFGLEFAGPDGKMHVPWVIHRAPLGSLERFVALLLEYYQGRLPGWLAPVQLLVIPVREEHGAFAAGLRDELLRAGVRAEADFGVGSLAKRIRAAHRLRPHALLVVGENEAKGGKLKLQLHGEMVELEHCNLRDVMLLQLHHE